MSVFVPHIVRVRRLLAPLCSALPVLSAYHQATAKGRRLEQDFAKGRSVRGFLDRLKQLRLDQSGLSLWEASGHLRLESQDGRYLLTRGVLASAHPHRPFDEWDDFERCLQEVSDGQLQLDIGVMTWRCGTLKVSFQARKVTSCCWEPS